MKKAYIAITVALVLTLLLSSVAYACDSDGVDWWHWPFFGQRVDINHDHMQTIMRLLESGEQSRLRWLLEGWYWEADKVHLQEALNIAHIRGDLSDMDQGCGIHIAWRYWWPDSQYRIWPQQ